MKNINFNSCVYYQEKIWFITTHGYFMNYDVREDKYSVIVPKNMDDLYFNQVVDNMIIWRGSIYFIEQNGTILYEYNIENNFIYSYKFPQIDMIKWECFSGVYLYYDELYFFTKNTKQIFIFDLKERRVKELNHEINYMIKKSIFESNIVYLLGENDLFIYDLQKNQYINKILLNINVVNICKDNDHIYMVDEKNNIYEAGVENFELRKLITIQSEEQTVGVLVSRENDIYIFPSSKGQILCINKKTKDVNIVAKPDDLIYNKPEWSRFYRYCVDNEDNIWLSNRQSNYLVCVVKKDNKVHWKKVMGVPDLDLMPYLRKQSVIQEEDMSLQNFIGAYIEEFEVKK